MSDEKWEWMMTSKMYLILIKTRKILLFKMDKLWTNKLEDFEKKCTNRKQNNSKILDKKRVSYFCKVFCSELITKQILYKKKTFSKKYCECM